MITIPSALPGLHVGTHSAGTGRACIMNAIAYMKGDTQISDMPDCVWGPFAEMAQLVNDRLCLHLKEVQTSEPILSGGEDPEVISYRSVRKLCSACAHKVWMMGTPLIGTGELGRALPPLAAGRLKRRMAEHIREAAGEGFPVSLGALGINTPSGALWLASTTMVRAFGRIDQQDRDCHYGAYRLMQHLDVFVDWLHEAAGQPVPQQYTVTAEQVAKVPVGVS